MQVCQNFYFFKKYPVYYTSSTSVRLKATNAVIPAMKPIKKYIHFPICNTLNVLIVNDQDLKNRAPTTKNGIDFHSVGFAEKLNRSSNIAAIKPTVAPCMCIL